MTVALHDLLALAGAVVLAGVGGELFIKGVLGAAESLRIPKLLVATSLAAFATSSPELTVSSVAALAGKPEIGLGDALGSNVVNIALVFGLALLFGPLRIEAREHGREFILALAIPLLTFWFASDGLISRYEGFALLACFAVWMGAIIRSGLAAREIETAPNGSHPWRSLVFGLVGLVALVFAGRLFVAGTSGIASAFGVDGYIIGATAVAIGTSLPELVTVLLSRLRGHDDVGVGTLLGSNLFNGMAIVGVAASIHPINAPFMEIAVALGMGMLSLLLLIPGRGGVIGRSRGFMLLGAYGAFVFATVAVGRTV
ncbi:sodium:calcium antiporter [Sphingorhabdus sp.]|uniref:sodium:calcium antiporter n=1 Tax=Sphingorhabdus sp. TaxID=1902408 RepID=UPI0035B3F125